VDVTPIIPAGRQVIDSYGPRGFKVSGIAYEGAILVMPLATQAWAPRTMAEVTFASLEPIVTPGGVEILLLGCGRRMVLVAAELRRMLRGHGIVIDAMDTGAACRTYNILLAEDRRIAAALLPAA
jgi:uncharacterized protein